MVFHTVVYGTTQLYYGTTQLYYGTTQLYYGTTQLYYGTTQLLLIFHMNRNIKIKNSFKIVMEFCEKILESNFILEKADKP